MQRGKSMDADRHAHTPPHHRKQALAHTRSTQAYPHTHIDLHELIHIHTCTDINVCMHAQCVCMHRGALACTQTHTDTHTHTDLHKHIYTHTHRHRTA